MTVGLPRVAERLPAATEAAQCRHIPALDGVRGLAILLVLWVHFAPEALPGAHGGVDLLLHNLLNAGWAGVDLFFVLSGFLITGILLESRGRPGFFRNFYARRTLRIFPPYYAALFTVGGLFLCAGGPARLAGFTREQAWLWTYTSNIQVAHHGWVFVFGGVSLNHFWTLAVEEQFYLAWPLIVYLARPATLRRVCLTALPVSIGLRIYCVVDHNHFAAFALTPCRMDAFAIGALLALWKICPNAPTAKLGYWLFAGCGLLLVPVFCDMDWVQAVGRTLLAGFFAGLMLLAMHTPIRRIFEVAVLRAFGKYSYGLYVIHAPLYFLLKRWFPVERLGTPLHVIACVLTSFAAAWCSWHLLEKHFIALKRFFEPCRTSTEGIARDSQIVTANSDSPGRLNEAA